MKYLIRAFISLCLIAIAVIGLQFVASERVEVVILESMNADGQPQETRLWIVDDAGYQYLRASADAGWYQRLWRIRTLAWNVTASAALILPCPTWKKPSF